MTKTKKKAEKQPSFEELMGRLEEIAGELESGELGLEAAIERYEQGVKCYRQCHDILANAEKKVEILTRTPDGKLEAGPFEEETEEADETDGDESSGEETEGGKLPF